MTGDSVKLYSFWRSSACYRVRIALNLKRVAFETVAVNLPGNQQHEAAFKEVNPQEIIPVVMHGGRVLRQSLAIMEYLDETWPENPLLPSVARDRQRSRAIAQAIACEIHPLNNLRVMKYLETTFGANQDQRETWMRHWITEGFDALEKVLADNPSTGAFCEGDRPTIADCCLVPQVYNAKRFGVDMAPYANIERINADCLALEAFDRARPELQPDAPK